MRVRLSNVGVIENCDVEFTPGVTLIIGNSGSGKSTLMRSIYNIASNGFSDSDISFGKGRMKVAIDYNGNHIEYNRRTKSEKGERFYYTINNEPYTKVGRNALQQVSDILKIGDLDINGESINFNFNLQFSTPFLILGSQSTLYNVLTYRSTFDISSINDYYNIDVKNNSNEICTTVKLKERLEDNLCNLESQANNLSHIEQIYSDYIECKHKESVINELKSLLEKINIHNNYECKSDLLNETITDISSAIQAISILKEICDYRDKCKLNTSLNSIITKQCRLIDSYNRSIELTQSLIDLHRLSKILSYNNVVCDNLLIICKCINSSKKLLINEELLNDIIRQKVLLSKISKYSKIISILNSYNRNNIDLIQDLISISSKFSSISDINKSISGILSIEDSIHSKLSEFSVCPLCGGSLHNV